MTKQLDVAIIGSGSAGLCAALWLSTYNIRCKVFEKRNGPLKLGHADGVQCRTVEIFESFGLGTQLLTEAHRVTEVSFWSDQDSKQGIQRHGRTADPPIGLSHQPHVVLRQARVNELLIEEMKRRNGQDVDYNCNVLDLAFREQQQDDPDAYPVTLTVESQGVKETYDAKYVLGCDGAHSTTRHTLGFKMEGDSTDAVWGVMDVNVRTDFPDIRKKSTIRTQKGSVLLIPREDPDLVRFYVELPRGIDAHEVTLETIHKTARDIMQPYSLDFQGYLWWSSYAIGQRLANSMHRGHRIFLTGDACHTHSPKAGQGMNVSLQDGYNIGWKLGAVLSGHASQDILKTYVSERYETAKQLVDFDKHFSRMFASEVSGAASAQDFQSGFIESSKFTTGLSAKYAPSMLTSGSHKAQSKAIINGMRFPSAQVVRFCDSVSMQFASALPSDGRWRIVIFGGALQNVRKVNEIGKFLDSSDSPLRTSKGKHDAIDAVIEPLVVMSGDRTTIEFKDFHPVFWPQIGSMKLNDLRKIFFDDKSHHHGHGHAYSKYDIDPKEGLVVVVRPDQHVTASYKLEDYTELRGFFKGII